MSLIDSPPVLDLMPVTPEILLAEAGYVIDPENRGIQRRDPFVLAAACDIFVQEVTGKHVSGAPKLKTGAIAYPSLNLIKYTPTRPDIDRERIIEETWHVAHGHPDRSRFTNNRYNQPLEQQARASTLLTVATDTEIDYLLATNAPQTYTYYAGRFGITVKGMKERMALRSQTALLTHSTRTPSGLARFGNCDICTRRRWLTPHHRTYVRLGREWNTDGKMLCEECHRGQHSRPSQQLRLDITS